MNLSFRYLRGLQNLDLTSGFYFSYTYDLTHTLQYNLIQQQRTQTNIDNDNSTDNTCLATRYQPTWKYVWNEYLQEPIRSQVHPRWILFIVHGCQFLFFYGMDCSNILFRCYTSI